MVVRGRGGRGKRGYIIMLLLVCALGIVAFMRCNAESAQ